MAKAAKIFGSKKIMAASAIMAKMSRKAIGRQQRQYVAKAKARKRGSVMANRRSSASESNGGYTAIQKHRKWHPNGSMAQ